MFDLVPLLFSVLIVSVGVNGQNRWSQETLNLTTGVFLISENATTGKLSGTLGSFIRFLLTICSPFAKKGANSLQVTKLVLDEVLNVSYKGGG